MVKTAHLLNIQQQTHISDWLTTRKLGKKKPNSAEKPTYNYVSVHVCGWVGNAIKCFPI